eukprot:5989852-Heterocapsa_arctica.AAC.1
MSSKSNYICATAWQLVTAGTVASSASALHGSRSSAAPCFGSPPGRPVAGHGAPSGENRLSGHPPQEVGGSGPAAAGRPAAPAF